MKGIVLLNAYTKSAGANRQASRIAEELNALGVQTEMRLNGAFDADIFLPASVSRKNPISWSISIRTNIFRAFGKRKA